jgi:hypothetical protein
LPRSGNSAGLRIIQYFDSSAGMVQPTRIVCCAWEGLMPATTEANAAAATIHFEAIRIAPTPLFDADSRQRQMIWG